MPWPPVTVVPPDGSVHRLEAALRWLEELAAGQPAPGIGSTGAGCGLAGRHRVRTGG